MILKLGRRAKGHLVTLIEINVHLIRGINISERGLGWRDVKTFRIIRCIFCVIKCREVSPIPSLIGLCESILVSGELSHGTRLG